MTIRIFRGDGVPHDWQMPPAPPWRRFNGGPPVGRTFDDDWLTHHENDIERAQAYRADAREVELVNVAILLRRPLLVTGKPGTGKSTLAYTIAYELGLGPALHWPVTSRTTLQDGLYRYDAIARLQDSNLAAGTASPQTDIGRYVRLGPLGTALLPAERPRVLLIDEIDKSDVDLPNDLLNILEEGQFRIPELARITGSHVGVPVSLEHADVSVTVHGGTVRCLAFPIVVMTSNNEREFPPAFLRRCVRLDITEPDGQRLAGIVRAHLGQETLTASEDVVRQFLNHRLAGDLATDQLLNAIFLTMHSDVTGAEDRIALANLVMRHLGGGN